MKIIRRIIKYILFLILIIGVLFGLFLAFLTFTDYNPKTEIKLDIDQNSQLMIYSNEFKVTTFNIGYAGLDKDQDFFMDGGTGSRASSKEKVISNLDSIINFLNSVNSDFFLLQEIDFDSTRTFHTNQQEIINYNLDNYSGTYAVNYDVPWVPVPLTKPIGDVYAGLGILSKFEIDSSTRFQFPGKEKWPRQLALLDRCFIETRYIVDDKDLVIINLHMSAYDKGGTMREQQINFLVNYLQEEYDKGNYVVVGGDWNHELPGTDADSLNPGKERLGWVKTIDTEFTGYNWAVEKKIPTCRNNDKPYVKGENYIAIVDGFLVSDNIEIIEVNAADLGFEYSDHNPVTLTFKLK